MPRFNLPHEWMNRLDAMFNWDIDTEDSDISKGDNNTDTSTERANLITSRDSYGQHLMLDIDNTDVYVKESSTPGHYHIVFPQPIPEDDYDQIVTLLHRYEIIKEGNFQSYQRVGYFAIRPPWVKKGDTLKMVASGQIGPEKNYVDNADAVGEIMSACAHLGLELPQGVIDQINAKVNP